MKQQKFFKIILVVCALLTLAGCASTSTFDGSKVKNADSYQLDINTMNCTDIHTADDLVAPWHLAEDEKDNATAIEAIPGAMEFGSSMEITSGGYISWYIGRTVEPIHIR